jgi:hypothetical protein
LGKLVVAGLVGLFRAWPVARTPPASDPTQERLS